MKYVAAALLALPLTAHAGQPSLTANGGLEFLGSGDATSAGLRMHAGYGRSFGAGSVQPTLSLGATFGWSSLRVDDPSTPEGAVSLTLLEVGPEVTFALRFANGGWADNRVFVTGAWMYVGVDEEVRGMAVPGVEAGHAMRFGVGVNWVGSVARAVAESPPKTAGQFLWIMPQQLEIVFERSGGFDRYGAVLAWGL